MAWMVTEFYAEGGSDVAIKVTPGSGGVLQVVMNGEKIFDVADEDHKYPDLNRMRELRAALRTRIDAVPVGAAD